MLHGATVWHASQITDTVRVTHKNLPACCYHCLEASYPICLLFHFEGTAGRARQRLNKFGYSVLITESGDSSFPFRALPLGCCTPFT